LGAEASRYSYSGIAIGASSDANVRLFARAFPTDKLHRYPNIRSMREPAVPGKKEIIYGAHCC
jgi:hypothetical protein